MLAESGAVYGTKEVVLCAHPHCIEVFEVRPGKKYHSTECKNNAHALAREIGEKFLKRGTIKAALLENSERLQRVVKFLSDGKWHSTRAIIRECDVCAVSAVIGELRHPKNGFVIECHQLSKTVWEYKMVGGFEQLLRIA